MAQAMRLEKLIDKIPLMAVDAVCVAHKPDGSNAFRVVWVNDAFCQMFSCDKDAAVGGDPFELYHWDYVADFQSAHEEMLASGQTSFSQDTLCLRHDQSSFWGGVSFVLAQDVDGPGDYAITYWAQEDPQAAADFVLDRDPSLQATTVA